MTGRDEDPAAVAAGFLTVRDFLRYAVSRFNEAGLVYGHGTASALDEAAFLILETLHLPLDQLDPFLDARLTEGERMALATIVHRRVTTRLPAPYLTGSAYIQGHRFRVDERVLIPRSFLGELTAPGGPWPPVGPDPEDVTAILELCTGSGCLAILAALRFELAGVDAVDISADALDVARANVADYGLEDRIRLLHGDLYGPVGEARYDLIIANPPYVDAAAMAALPPEYRLEPAIALAGGEDGLDIVRRIIDGAADHLNPRGALICEIGTGRDDLETSYPDIDFLWLDSEESTGEVFWLDASAAPRR